MKQKLPGRNFLKRLAILSGITEFLALVAIPAQLMLLYECVGSASDCDSTLKTISVTAQITRIVLAATIATGAAAAVAYALKGRG